MIRRTALVALSLVLGFLLVFVATNCWDEKLSPAVKAILAQEPVISRQAERAFYYLLGLRIGATPTEAERIGRELWTQANRLPSDAQSEYYAKKFNNASGVWPSLRGHSRSSKISNRQFLRDSYAAGDDVANYKLPIQNYLQLLAYGDLKRPNTPMLFSRADIPYAELLKGHRLFELHLAKLAATSRMPEVERLVRLENNFYRKFFAHSPLLGVMIAQIIIKDNAFFLEQEKILQPSLKVKAETLASFEIAPPTELMQMALRSELRFFYRVANEMSDYAILSSFVFPNLSPKAFVETHLLVRPNASLNRYFEKMQIRYDDEALIPWWKGELPVSWLRNPMGKWLTTVMLTGIGGRQKKMEQNALDLANSLTHLTKAR